MSRTTENRRKKQRRKSESFEREAYLCEGIEAQIQAAGDDQSPPNLEATAYSGGKLYVKGFDVPVVMELSGMKVNANANLLLDHNSKQRVGHPENIAITDVIRVTGKLSASSEYRDEVLASHKDGFKWHLSIGARIIQGKRVAKGQTVFANGRHHQGPLILATQSRLNEISFVGNGGDEDTNVRIAAERAAEETDMADETTVDATETEVEAAAETVETKQVDPVQESHHVESTDLVAEMRANAAAEATRIAGVNEKLSEYPELRAQAIGEGWDGDKLELEIYKAKDAKLEALRKERPTGPAIHSRNSEELRDVDVHAAAFHQSAFPDANLDVLASGYGEQAMERSKRLPKHMSFHTLLRQNVEAAGGYVDWRKPFTPDEYGYAVEAEGKLKGMVEASTEGGFSTFSLAGILSNVQNKTLLGVYSEWPSLVSEICTTTQHNNFKKRSIYRMEADLELERLAPTGEINLGTIAEEVYENQVFAYAKRFSIDQQTFIDDDLGAFAQMATHQANAAMRTREKVMFTKLLNPALVGVGAFFDNTVGANKRNHLTGTNMDVAGLAAAKTTFRKMKSKEGNPTMIQPRAVLSSVELEETAMNLLGKTTIQVTNDAAGSTNTGNEFRVQEQFRGRFSHEATPWLDTNSGVPNATDTTWFLLGDKSNGGAMEYAHLTGQERPMTGTDTMFLSWGFGTRIIWSFGFAERLPEAIVRVDA